MHKSTLNNDILALVNRKLDLSKLFKLLPNAKSQREEACYLNNIGVLLREYGYPAVAIQFHDRELALSIQYLDKKGMI